MAFALENNTDTCSTIWGSGDKRHTSDSLRDENKRAKTEADDGFYRWI